VNRFAASRAALARIRTAGKRRWLMVGSVWSLD